MWVGACGAMSRKATMSSSWWTIVAGMPPAAIRQKSQSGFAMCVLLAVALMLPGVAQAPGLAIISQPMTPTAAAIP